MNSGLPWPSLRVTVGLSPAWLPKQGPTLDLPVATVLATLAVLERRELVAGRHGRYRVDGPLLATTALPEAR